MENTIAIESFNEASLKKSLINFERKNDDNLKLRMKHAENPSKFALSETELFASLNELQGVATQPELYHVLVSRDTISKLLNLIGHENTDISAKVIHMLQELTDLNESDDPKPTKELIETVLKADIISLLVPNLNRLDEHIEEESQAINHSLEIIENLIKHDSKASTIQSRLLISWMIKLLSKNLEFDTIKNSIVELLAALMLNAEENKSYLGELHGIDALLQQVAHYRRVAPAIGDEHEYLEQTIDCLCIAVQNCDRNRELFLEEEGVDLVVLVLREKREAIRKSSIKLSILKLFNHVLTTDENQDSIVTKCCDRFVENLGLRVIFPIFQNPKLILSQRVKKSEYYKILGEAEEHSSAILLALLKHCRNSEHIQRILVKFADNKYDKLNRAIELHDKYFRFIQNHDSGDDEDELKEDLMTRASFILETIDYIILLICFLAQQYETYDPVSGETFSNYMTTTLSQRPELKHQIVLETSRLIDDLADDSAVRNSLELLVKNFEQLNKKKS